MRAASRPTSGARGQITCWRCRTRIFCRSARWRTDRLLADVFVWQTEDFVYLEHFAVQPSLRGQGTGSRILRELLQGKKPFILEIEPPEDALTCRRKAFYERNGLQAQPYDHVQLPFQGGGPIVPLVIMADRAISPAQCRTFQRYLLDRVVKYTQYGK